MANREVVETVRGKRGPVDVLKEGSVLGATKYWAHSQSNNEWKGPFSDYRDAFTAAQKMAG